MLRKITLHNSARPSFFSFPLRLLLPLAIVLLCCSLASAATWYVKPSAEVPVRSGQGSDFKILAVVPDGMAVELLEEVDTWARVRTPAGTEGWLLKRYLTSEPPLATTFAALQSQKAQLEGTSQETSRKLREVSAAHAQIEQELNVCRIDRDEALDNYETLRRDTADVIGLQKKLAETTRELQVNREKLTALDLAAKEQKRNSSLMWFLAGALVMLGGWLMGMLTARTRKRKTSLY